MSTAASTSNFHKTRHNYLSYSQLSDFQRCRYRWSLRYFRGLQSRKTVRPLMLGDAVHQAIAAYFLEGTTPRDFLDQWRGERLGDVLEDQELDQLNEVWSSAPPIAQRALDKISEMGWEPLTIDGRPAIEIDFKVPVPGFDAFIIHADAIFYDRPNNTIHVADYKVRTSYMQPESEMMNLQHAIYQIVLRKNGIPVSSSATIELRNQAPRKPTLTQKGTMSRAAIISDWPTYEAALIDALLDPADYADMKMKLSNSEFVRVTTSYRAQPELDNLWNHVVLPTAAQIVEERTKLQEDPSYIPIRSISWMGQCQNCNFLELCNQNLAGYDVSPILSLFDVAPKEK